MGEPQDKIKFILEPALSEIPFYTRGFLCFRYERVVSMDIDKGILPMINTLLNKFDICFALNFVDLVMFV